MAKIYGERPSSLLHFDWQDYDWLEYSFDRAVMIYGQWVDNELAKTDKEGNQLRSLKEILDAGPIQPPPPPSAQDFISAFGGLAAIKP